jgi:protein involved in polysaccharide export with SLBB domain
MIKIDNTTKRISINRGDDNVGFTFSIPLEDDEKYEFQIGDVITFGVYGKNKLEEPALILKEITIQQATEQVDILLSTAETSIGELTNKPVECWYEIQLNKNTIIGYDEKGAKKFIVYPEGSDIQ